MVVENDCCGPIVANIRPPILLLREIFPANQETQVKGQYRGPANGGDVYGGIQNYKSALPRPFETTGILCS